MDAPAAVVGRGTELGAVARFVTDAEAGAACLVLQGAAGIGKSTVWEASVAAAREGGLQVLVCRPAVEEAGFGFSGLADLLAEVGPEVAATLPAAQRQALESALLIGDDAAEADPRACSSAVLGVIRALARRGALLIAVDDVQWLDSASAGALAFALRRLRDEPVRVLVTRRAPEATSSPLERSTSSTVLPVLPLSFGAVCRLLQQRLAVTFSRATSRRIYESSGGNPLFALELARMVADRGGRLDAGDDLPLPLVVETALEERLQSLTPPVRRVLLAAELAGAAAAIALEAVVDAEAVEEAITAGVVVVADGRIRPAHPLLGAAAKARARDSEIRDLHLRIAGSALDEEHAARHLALARRLPDEQTAETVAAAAERAGRRGAAASAAELGEYALRLTPGTSDAWVGRLLAAAEYRAAAGELGRVRELLEGRVEELPAGHARVHAMLLLYQADAVAGSRREYLDRALDEAAGDPRLTSRVLAKLAYDTAVAEVTPSHEALSWAEDAARVAGDRDEPASLAVLMWVRHLRGLASDDVLARYQSVDGTFVSVWGSAERAQAVRRTWRGELAEARAALTSLLRLADERGEAESYFVARLQLCELELRAGRWAAAEALLDEWAVQDEEPMGNSPSYVRCCAQLAAGRGRVEDTRRLALEAIALADAAGSPWQRLEALRALGTAELLAADPAAAVRHLGEVWQHTQTSGIGDPGAFPVGPELVEARAAIGDVEGARSVAAELEHLAERQQHPWALAAALRSRGLVFLAERRELEAEAALADAAERYAALDLPFDSARVLISLGTARRRLRRMRAGRETLERAADILAELGSDGWAAHARAELERFGGRRAATGLTPTERRVAELVARGLSNKQVAGELVVSVSAVERHLTRIYEKLGVRSRLELATQTVGVSVLPPPAGAS